ncbi:HNH endonuclease [Bacillus sp. EB01]|uniref:HNH endonuclease n=1 Tax=Bacillus sp. EB01 TaxID=1347086 RepID=UPI0005C47039|nr:HNH endonuclease domain-containing protein [Bacillus sp. EB01]
MSWDLQVGEITEKYLTDEDIWISLNNFYFKSSVNMSYKYGFLKSILENLYNLNEELELNYDKLFYSFTKIYWNLVIHHNLWQSSSISQPSKIQRILQDYAVKYSIPSDLTFDKLQDSLQLDIIKEVKKNGKRYVIGAFYSDINGYFYEFDLKEEHLRFNPPVFKFLQKYQRLITYMTNYHLAIFLEKHNLVPHINYLLTKVENISKRNSLYEYLDFLIRHDNNICFYCNRVLSKESRKTHVDHFIPWSYIQSDNLWNLVLSCSTCNSRKSDKLADHYYLEGIIIRNEQLVKEELNETVNYFENYRKEKLIQLYDYSKHNGISEIWVPN